MKFKKKYVLALIVSILIILLGTTYAYFKPRISGNSKKITLKANGLYIKYEGSLSIPSQSIEPGWETSFNFTVTSTSKSTETYDIYLKDLINTFVTDGYLQYKITSDNGFNMSGYEDVPKSIIEKDTLLINLISINSNATHTYTVSFRYLSTEDDQSSDMGKKLSGTLMIKAGTQDLEGAQVALGDTLQSQIPSFSTYRGKLEAVVECSTGSAKFNYEKWQLEAELGSNCSLTFQDKSTNKTYLNDYVISLNNQTVGDGKVVNENGYRYEGTNPNNYVLYNGELWRIIGVFGNGMHGQTGNLVKIIRNDSIGGLVYTTASGINSWEESALYKLLNQTSGGSYYTGVDYTNKASGTYCSSSDNYTPIDCSFSKKGIRSDYAREMIQETQWYSTPYTSISNAPTTYTYDITTTTSNTGYIGLMYASDYGYAVQASDCARTISLGSYYGTTNGLTCAGKNWLRLGENEWTISRYSNIYSLYLNYSGTVRNTSVFHASEVRPVLYLKSSVYYVSGSGTMDDPIVIGN